MKKTIIFLYIIFILNYLEAKFAPKDINAREESIYARDSNILFKGFNTNTIEIGDISIEDLDGHLEIVISNCKSQNIIKTQKIFELSIKNYDENAICIIPKLKFDEISSFNIRCKINSKNGLIYNNEIVLNKIPFLKNFIFKGFEKYIQNLDYEIINPYNIYNEDQDKQIYTLTAGYILKENCYNNIYKFSLYNNQLDGDAIDGEFKLGILNFNKPALCQYISNNNRILCNIEVNSDNEYCKNIYKDIRIKYIVEKEYIEDKAGNQLWLKGFNGLESITVEAGDLIKGNCIDNIYEFKFKNSILYNDNLDNDIQFKFKLSSPAGLEPICSLSSNSEEKLTSDISEKEIDINCKIIGTTNNCPIPDEKTDLILGGNKPSDYLISVSKRITFKKFAEKSTIIKISAKNLKKLKEDDKYFLIFSYSMNNNYLNEEEISSISFNINYKDEEDNNFKKASCKMNSEYIKCEMKNVESDDINIIISEEPLDMYNIIKEKTIIFENFKDKKIITLVANTIIKGKCNEENKLYSFKIEVTKKITLPIKDFFLQMKYPELVFTCNIDLNQNSEINSIICSREGTSTCVIDSKENIVVGDSNPEPIQIDENSILYFSSFAGKSTFPIKISVGTLLKKNIQNNKYYYFSFSDIEVDNTNKITVSFSFKMFFNENEVDAICKCVNTQLSCYFNLEENIESNEILNYDLRIGNIEVDNSDLFLDGFSNQETFTVLFGNIDEKKIVEDKFIFIIKNNKNIEKIGTLKENKSFKIKFYTSEDNKDNKIDAECVIEENNIKCESDDKSLKEDNDVILDEYILNTDVPYLILNNNSFYFKNDKKLRTYTIIAGKIKKPECKEVGQNYVFNLLGTIFPLENPKEIDVEMKIKVDNEDNEPNEAICSLKKSSVECIIKDINCAQEIILTGNNIENNPDKELVSPNTIFFNGFNNRRTFTILAGKLNKGECDIDKNQYSFTFTNNKINYNNNKFRIKFKLKSDENSNIDAVCDISKEDNTIVCKANTCLNDEEDIEIISGDREDYTTEDPNTISYKGFNGKNTVTIKNEKGKIIKGETIDNTFTFYIKDNKINEINEKKKKLNIEV